MSDQIMPTSPKKNRVSLSIDYRIIIFVLAAIIACMLVMWKPWQSSAVTSDRTVTVTGQAKITAQPDEFIFHPSYTFVNANKDAALEELNQKSNEIVNKLKELGVKENKIKTNSNGNDYRFYSEPGNKHETTYVLSLTVTVGSKEEAQKVQDYLVTTGPQGAISPQASFSDTKRNELENQARDKATKDARVKADQSAKNLGFKVGKVKSVEDNAGFNGVYPLMSEGATTTQSKPVPRLAVQPGENELSYSVTVVYFVR